MELPPKKTLERWHVPGVARFLTFSCYRRLPLLNNDRIKDRVAAHLAAALERHRLPPIAWVVMPEHIHLIVSPPAEGSTTAFLNALKNPIAREVLGRWRMLDAAVLPRLRDRRGNVHFWQAGGGYDRHVAGEELIEKIRYVHGNPVERGLSPDSVSWQWSSAAAYRGRPRNGDPAIAFDLLR